MKKMVLILLILSGYLFANKYFLSIRDKDTYRECHYTMLIDGEVTESKGDQWVADSITNCASILNVPESKVVVTTLQVEQE